MSGRDLRNFVTNHRAEDADKLVTRVKDGLYSSKYKQIDYDKLKAFTAEKKFAGQEKLIKVKKLQEVSKQGKEQNLLKQHHMVWKKEFSHLNSLRNHNQADIDSHIQQNLDSELLEHIYQEFEHYDSKLDRDLVKFREGTVTPVWELRDDLRYWTQEQKAGSQNPNVEEDPEQVRSTINRLKQQQDNILERLHHEQKVLEDELQMGDLPTLAVLPLEKRIQTGIPEEAFDLECPDLDLKASVLQEFIFLDQKYLEKLEEIEAEHYEAVQSPTGGWSEDDHHMFLYVVDQYTHDVPNRRMLYIDRLKRHLPHKTRTNIVSHEEWWTLYKYYHERRKDLIVDWSRDRRELLNRAKVVFAEFVAAGELEEKKKEFREHQRELCDTLYSKIQQWREQKLEAMQLQHEQQEARRKEWLETLKQQEQREKSRREKEKDKVHVYHDEQAAIRQQQQEKDRLRLEALRKDLEEQATYDKQRVRFRDAEQQRKTEAQFKKEEDKLAAAEEKERILEKIREKVRPHVDGDLLRLWSDTEAWKARVWGEEEEPNLQKPLFEINTFTANKVASDPRFRLAEKLHQAGLTHNPYAAEVMKQTQPLHAPRKDMASSILK